MTVRNSTYPVVVFGRFIDGAASLGYNNTVVVTVPNSYLYKIRFAGKT